MGIKVQLSGPVKVIIIQQAIQNTISYEFLIW